MAFSIVIPLYNKEKYIDRTVRSVLSQTYEDFEVIVVDDGSTDNSVAVLKQFNDGRIRIVRQENAGVSAARNRGIKEAKNELIAFLDADDEWLPTYLSTIHELVLEYPVCSVFATNYIIKEEAGGKVLETCIVGLPDNFTEGIITDYFGIVSRSNPLLWTSAVVVRKQALMYIGGFPEGITSGEDLITWARLANEFHVAYTREAQSVFHSLGRPQNERRTNDEFDFVGLELKKIVVEQNAKLKSLKSYLGYWYKMRTSIFLEVGDTKHARSTVLRALKYSKGKKVLSIFFFLSFLPSSFSQKLYNVLRSQNQKGR